TSVKRLRVYAWRGGVENFGDELGPVVLRRLGHDVERVEHIHEADLLAAGSLLESAAENAKDGTVLGGSGLLYGEEVDLSGLDVATGDPGSLVGMLWKRPPVRRSVGVLRHYADDREYPWADCVMDADSPVESVIDFIGSCERLASSSLHGVIVAASWGIPAVRLHHEAVAGGDFKWADWLSGAGDPENLLAALE